MTRLFTEGFETGDQYAFDSVTNIAMTATVRSGTYSMGGSNGGMAYKYITPIAELYTRYAFYFSTYAGNRMITVTDNAGVELGRITMVGTIGVNYVQARWPSSVVATGTLSLISGAGNYYVMELYIKIAASGGRIIVKINGTTEIDYTGNTGTTNVGRVGWGLDTGANQNWGIDDIALNDVNGGVDNSWCGDGHVIALLPNAAGDVTQQTRSTGANSWALVDERPHNSDTDYVESSTVDQYDLYNLTASGLSNVTINRVWVEARARDTVAAAAGLQVGLKTGGTEYWSSTLTLQTTYVASKALKGGEYLTNPQSTNPWTTTDLDALQAGTKVK